MECIYEIAVDSLTLSLGALLTLFFMSLILVSVIAIFRDDRYVASSRWRDQCKTVVTVVHGGDGVTVIEG